jgi:hypothetical protein
MIDHACVKSCRPGVEQLEPRLLLNVSQAATPGINPRDFVAHITNPFEPWDPGVVRIYQGTKGSQSVLDIVYVTHQTKDIVGVDTTVVRDTVYVNGQLEERAFDWFAQDKAGNVWYFGEDTKEFKNGVVVSTAGSWETGVKGARPGIVMQAHPDVGDTYQQEFAKGVAQDMATILSLQASTTVPFGSFNNCLLTKEFSPLEPGFVEHKFYAAGVGFIRSVSVQGKPHETLQLVAIFNDDDDEAGGASAPLASERHAPSVDGSGVRGRMFTDSQPALGALAWLAHEGVQVGHFGQDATGYPIGLTSSSTPALKAAERGAAGGIAVEAHARLAAAFQLGLVEDGRGAPSAQESQASLWSFQQW